MIVEVGGGGGGGAQMFDGNCDHSCAMCISPHITYGDLGGTLTENFGIFSEAF